MLYLRCCLACCFVFSIALAAHAEDYPVRLSFPSKVGDRSKTSYVAESKNHSVVTVNDRDTDRDDNHKVEIEGIEEVRTIDAKGNATRIAFTVKRCEEIMPDGKPRTIIAPGRMISMTCHDGDMIYMLDTGRVAPKDEALLRLALHVSEANMPDDDELFGTKQRKSIGDTWPVNREAMSRRLREPSYDTVDPKNIKGTVKLVAVEDVPDVGKCEHVEVDFTVQKMTGNLQGYKLEDGTFESIDAILIPMKGVDPIQESSASTFHQIYSASYGDSTVRVVSDTTRTIEVKRKALPPKVETQTTQPTTVPSTRPKPKPLQKAPTTRPTETANAEQVR
jgi:hypothetical protein